MEKVGRQTLLGLAVLFIVDRGVFPCLFKTAIDFCGLVE